MSDDFKIRFGSLEEFEVTRGDESAISVTWILSDKDTNEVFSFTSMYNSEGIAIITLDDLPVGEYEYQVNENFESGDQSIYPDPKDCEDDSCELPTLEVCYSIVEGSSS